MSLQPHESQHARPPCPSPTPWVYSNSCPSSQWCHLAISSSVFPFSSCSQSLPASGSFPMSQLFVGSQKKFFFPSRRNSKANNVYSLVLRLILNHQLLENKIQTIKGIHCSHNWMAQGWVKHQAKLDPALIFWNEDLISFFLFFS